MNAPKFAGFLAGLAGAMLFVAPAQAKVYEGGITHAEMQKLLVDAGFNALAVEEEDAKPDAVPDLVVMGGPARWYVEFMACKEGRCADLHLHAGFNVEGAVSQAIVTEMNQALLGKLSGNVYVDDEQDPILQADVNTDGVTDAHLIYQVRSFDALDRLMCTHVGYWSKADTASAYDKLLLVATPKVPTEDKADVIDAIEAKDFQSMLEDDGFRVTEARATSTALAKSFVVSKSGAAWFAEVPLIDDWRVTFSAMPEVFFKNGSAIANNFNREHRWVSLTCPSIYMDGRLAVVLRGGITRHALVVMANTFDEMLHTLPGGMGEKK